MKSYKFHAVLPRWRIEDMQGSLDFTAETNIRWTFDDELTSFFIFLPGRAQIHPLSNRIARLVTISRLSVAGGRFSPVFFD